jgi:hypothetical protein
MRSCGYDFIYFNRAGTFLETRASSDGSLKNFCNWRNFPMRKKLLFILVFTLALFIFQTPSAFACGGLVAPDGDVRLERATTLVAWHNGIEHYLTSFAYQGTQPNVGWIVPLPAVPEKIEAGGAWTFQRLERESRPQKFEDRVAFTSAAPGAAEVLQQVKVEALDVTVIKGSGMEILNWAGQNGFFVDEHTRAHLLVYAQGSPIFMAAKYDTQAAEARNQIQGNGVPLLITMKTAHPWVPLDVLAIDGQQVQADLYFLTDVPLNISDVNAKAGQSAVGSNIPGSTGFTVAFQEKMTEQLYKDLSSDRNMGWVQPNSWFTYLSLNAPSEKVTYDLGISNDGVIHLAPFGKAPMSVVDGVDSMPRWLPLLPLNTPQWVVGFLVVFAVIFLAWRVIRRRRGTRKKVLNGGSVEVEREREGTVV